MSKNIVVSDEGKKKLDKIKVMRPQDTSMAQTIDYLIYVYEEQKFRSVIAGRPVPKEKGAASPIIDAEKLQNVSQVVRENK